MMRHLWQIGAMRRIRTGGWLLVPAALAALTAAGARAETPGLAEQLIALEKARQAAYVSGDRAELERQFAVEYTHTNLRGETTGRAAEFDFYKPGTFSLTAGSVDDVTVHDYGDVAVLLGTVHWRGAAYRPAPDTVIDLSGDFRVTRVYVRRDGRWQLATSHASLIPPADAPTQP